MSLCFFPADRRGFVGVRRAYAIAGIDDLIVGGTLAGFLTAAFTGLTFLGGQAATAEEKAEIDRQAYNEFSAAYADSAQWLYDNSSAYVNETASGWQVDTSQIPDSVVSDIQSFAAAEVSPSFGAGVVPPSYLAYSSFAGCFTSVRGSATFTGDFYAGLPAIMASYPYMIACCCHYAGGGTKFDRHHVIFSASPITFSLVNNSYVFTSSTGVFGKAYDSGTFNTAYMAYTDVTYSSALPSNPNVSSTYTVSNSRNYSEIGILYSATQSWAASSVADSPSAISDAMADLQAALANAEDTTAQLQAALDAVRAGNPQIAIPSDYSPTVINNYNEYVTYTTATPANPADVDTPSIDMGELAQAIADALGGGVTLAQILNTIRGWGVDTDMTDVLSLLLNISNKIESDLERQQRQAELNADLDEIIRLLTSINETLTGIARDMANLDRSTNDLVDLSTLESGVSGLSSDIGALLSAITGSHGADALGLYGRLDTVLNWLDDYVPVDVSGIEQVLRDWPDYPVFDDSDLLNAITGSHGVDLLGLFGRLDNVLSWLDSYVAPDLATLNHQLGDFTESDGQTLTVHGLLHWINYYAQDADRAIHDVLALGTVTMGGNTYGFTDLLYNIWLDLGQFCDDFVSYWNGVIRKLDGVISAIERLDLKTVYPSSPNVSRPTQSDLRERIDWSEWDNAVSTLSHKFPFVIINDIVLILTALTRPAVTPVFDLPVPNPSDWSSPYLLHVDLSDFDSMAAVMRVGITLWVIARVSRRTLALWTSNEGSAV